LRLNVDRKEANTGEQEETNNLGHNT
jgi:hypothetical protein